MLKDILDVALRRNLGTDRSVAEHAVIQRQLGLGGLVTGRVLAQGDSVVEVHVESQQRAVLHAQCA